MTNKKDDIKTHTTISFKVAIGEAAHIAEIQELMSFGSQRETVQFLVRQGICAMKAGTGAKLNAGDFARSLWSIGRYGLETGGVLMETEEAPVVADTLRGYEEWVKKKHEMEVGRVRNIRNKRLRKAIPPQV